MEHAGNKGDDATARAPTFKRAKLKGGKNWEQHLAIGVITDTGFLREMKEDIEDNLKVIKNNTIRQILMWCLAHYEDYGRSPHLNIQDVFEAKRDGLRPADEDLLEEWLFQLSRKFDEMEDFDAAFEVAEIRQSMYAERMHATFKQANKLIEQEKPEEAMELVLKEGLLPSNKKDLKNMVLMVTEFITTEIPKSKTLIKPWLTKSSLTMIYGKRGIGKTWLSHLLAIALTRKDSDMDIGSWSTRRSASVLLVDGEMSKYQIQSRLKYLVETYGMQEGSALYLLAESMDFTREKERAAISEIVRQKEIEVLFLDNIACLFPGLDENSKQDWDPVNHWLLSLRAMGTAVILIHHAGKTNRQRGTSAREDALDNIIKLSRPKHYQPSQGARFWVQFDKARNALPDSALDSFELSVKDMIMYAEE